MKKIYSFVFAAIAILSAASCQKEIINAPEVDTDAVPFSFVAERDAETKTVLVNGKSTWWTPGDKVSAFDADGEEVLFNAFKADNSGVLSENSPKALFYTASYSIPEDYNIVAIYPYREGNATIKNGVINNLRIAGTQQAVAGSFDPAFGVAYAKGIVTDPQTPPELKFENIHTLVKFTIAEGSDVPSTISLKSFASRMCVGLFYHNINTKETACTAGGHEVTLTAPEGGFKAGDTYYIALVPGATKQLTLYFDGLVAFTAGTDVVKTLEANKIYNLGVVEKPEVIETPFELERVAAYYSDGANPWCSFIPGISNRTMTSDGQNVYLQSSEATPKIYAVSISSLLAGEPDYTTLSTANMTGGTHGVSALRCIPNEEGAPVLIATNLAVDDSQNFNIYAYSAGIDADPVLFHAYRWDAVANTGDWRRYGDRISVSGTWQNGTIWAASQSGTKVMAFHIENGATASNHREYCWFDTFAGGLAEVTVYPETKEALLTTASSAGLWTPNVDGEKHPGGFWPKWDAIGSIAEANGAFSFQFFSYDGKDYIAFVQLTNNTHAYLVVVEDKGSLEASLTSKKLFELPLYDGSAASCEAANTYGDCSVVTIDGELHIIAMMQGGGLSIFKIK